MPDALPAAALPIYPGLGPAPGYATGAYRLGLTFACQLRLNLKAAGGLNSLLSFSYSLPT